MKIFHSIEEYRDYTRREDVRRRTAVTLGKFDGVHLGHRKLIRRIRNEADRQGLDTVLFAIEIRGKGILSRRERADLLEKLGIDVLIECPFTRQFMAMPPEAFAGDVLAGTLHTSFAAVGTDYRFGAGRSGDAQLLRQLGSELGFETDIVEKECYLSEEISSSRVRDAVAAGEMELASAMLGSPFPVSGTIAHGRHIGTGLGMPTLNLECTEDKILPPDGVYASRSVLADGSCRDGVTNIGLRPTVGGKHRRTETTLFDFSGDLYGQELTVFLVSRIRGEIRFDSLDALREQVEADSRKAARILRAGAPFTAS